MGKRKTIEHHHAAGRRLAVGVDPSINRTAFAVWDLDERVFVAFATYPYVRARKIGLMINAEASLAKFYVENPGEHTYIYRRVLQKWRDRMSKQEFSKWLAQVNAQAMSIGQNIGAAKLLIEEWKEAGLRVYPEAPTTKKKDADVFRALTGYKGSTNQDERDAGMRVFGR